MAVIKRSAGAAAGAAPGAAGSAAVPGNGILSAVDPHKLDTGSPATGKY